MPVPMLPPSPISLDPIPLWSDDDSEFTDSIFTSFKSRTVHAHHGRVYALCWNKTGDKLASASHDTTLKIWGCEGIHPSRIERPLLECRGHNGVVANLTWSPTENDTLVSISADKTAGFWDARTGNCVATVDVQGSPIFLSCSPSGGEVCVVTKDNVLRVINCQTRLVVGSKTFDYEINDVRWAATGKHLLVVTGEGNLEILEYPSLKSTRKHFSHTRIARCIAVDQKGEMIATAGDDASILIRKLSDLSWVSSYYDFDSPVRSIAFSHNAEYLAFSTEEAYIDVVRVEDMKHVHQFKCQVASDSISWHPQEMVMTYVGDEDGGFSVFS